jgi:hypothetical protein
MGNVLEAMRTYEMTPTEVTPIVEWAMTEMDVPALAALVSHFRGRAAYHEGRCEAMRDTIEYLKARVATLEATAEAAPDVGPGGGR